MSMTSDSVRSQSETNAHVEKRIYRSNTQRAIAGICGGLGEYFAMDPVWFRIGFVVLAIGGGSGILIYLLMWLVIPPAPDGYVPTQAGKATSFTGATVLGAVFVIVGTIALVNSVAPSLGQYIWPIVLVAGGLALVLGGVNRDTH